MQPLVLTVTLGALAMMTILACRRFSVVVRAGPRFASPGLAQTSLAFSHPENFLVPRPPAMAFFLFLRYIIARHCQLVIASWDSEP
jgi:hypothetical protein